MDLKDKKTKVVLCRKCGGFILACHTDYLKYANEGYEINLETLEKTKSRELVFPSDNNNGECKKCNKEL